jgi:hypothetical protein
MFQCYCFKIVFIIVIVEKTQRNRWRTSVETWFDLARHLFSGTITHLNTGQGGGGQFALLAFLYQAITCKNT